MENNVILKYSIFNTFFGLCGILWSEKGIVKLILPGMTKDGLVSAINCQKSAISKGRFIDIEDSVKRYFDGKRVNFDFPLDLSYSSPFQQRVYKITKTIPYGEVKTYKWIATRIGLPYASRAVGNALSKNPIPLLIPCHRIIRKDGEMGGFTASGGIGFKRKMLNMERRL